MCKYIHKEAFQDASKHVVRTMPNMWLGFKLRTVKRSQVIPNYVGGFEVFNLIENLWST